MGWFQDIGNANGATGTLIKQKYYIPSQEGALAYFGSKNVENELDRIEKAGGKIHQPKLKFHLSMATWQFLLIQKVIEWLYTHKIKDVFYFYLILCILHNIH